MTAGSATLQFIRSPRWDAFWIFSGVWAPALSMLVFLLVRALSANPLDIHAPGYDVRSFALLYLPLAILHRIGTTWAVLATPLLREDLRANPSRYVHVPLLILAGCVALGLLFAFHASLDVFESDHAQLWAYFALAYVMVLWERWHFCAQEFGVLSIYRIRAGQHAAQDKRFDRIFTVVLMLGVNMVLFLCLGFADERDVLLHDTALGAYRGERLEHAGFAAFAIGVVTLLVALVREWRHPRRSLPKLLFYALVGAHTLLLFVFPHAIGMFFLSYVFHHWMVAVGLFGLITVAAQPGDTTRARLSQLARRFGPLLVLSVLFYVFFGVLDKAGNLSPLPDTRMFEGASVGAKALAGVVVGLFFAINYLHYYFDRCFYAFSNPAVRARVAPLLFAKPAQAGS